MGSINCRLRPGKDSDIIAALETVPKYLETSDIVRAALRLYFAHDGPEPIKMEVVNLKPVEASANSESKLDDLLHGL